jgi:hypothetical protein
VLTHGHTITSTKEFGPQLTISYDHTLIGRQTRQAVCVEERGGAGEERGGATEDRGGAKEEKRGTREVPPEMCQFLPKPDSKTKGLNPASTLYMKSIKFFTLFLKYVFLRR